MAGRLLTRPVGELAGDAGSIWTVCLRLLFVPAVACLVKRAEGERCDPWKQQNTVICFAKMTTWACSSVAVGNL